uniref:uncharacterized protein LOC117605494 n=1 Tax=Osmia lignaria TaxID=473952 RepID=UPI001478E394|nr:uncharacterized protein LOC117605494 [Osmia lignaria]
MRYFLLFMVAVVCEGTRIPRISESFFPGFQGAHHGHGGHRYQHGQLDNYGPVQFPGDHRAPYGNLDIGNEFYGHQGAIGGHANVADHFAGGPFNVAGNHGGFNPHQALPRNYERYNHAHDYDY